MFKNGNFWKASCGVLVTVNLGLGALFIQEYTQNAARDAAIEKLEEATKLRYTSTEASDDKKELREEIDENERACEELRERVVRLEVKVNQKP